VELGYNDIGLCDTSIIASDVLWYQLIPHFFKKKLYNPQLEQHSFVTHKIYSHFPYVIIELRLFMSANRHCFNIRIWVSFKNVKFYELSGVFEMVKLMNSSIINVNS